nr:hypothetical protein GCM10017611_10910 [Rhodococcus wratislaviensis]
MEVEEGVDVAVHLEHDVTATPAVAAIRATEWFELLPVYGGAAIAAFSGADVQHDAVNESGHDCRILPQPIVLISL